MAAIRSACRQPGGKASGRRISLQAEPLLRARAHREPAALVLFSESAHGSAPMPMFPSRSNKLLHLPAPGTRSKTERCKAHAPWRRARRTAEGAMSIPSTATPDRARAAACLPGPQPTSKTGADASPSTSRSSSDAASIHRSIAMGSELPSSWTRPSLEPVFN